MYFGAEFLCNAVLRCARIVRKRWVLFKRPQARSTLGGSPRTYQRSIRTAKPALFCGAPALLLGLDEVACFGVTPVVSLTSAITRFDRAARRGFARSLGRLACARFTKTREELTALRHANSGFTAASGGDKPLRFAKPWAKRAREWKTRMRRRL